MKLIVMLGIAVLTLLPRQESEKGSHPSEEEAGRIAAAVPEKASALPLKPRKVLVLGDEASHEPVPYCAKAMEILGKKTSAFEPVITKDGAWLEPERLREFDAVVANNWHGFNFFLPFPKREFNVLPENRQAELRVVEKRRRQSLINFLRGGKGLIVIHASTFGYRDWPEWSEMIGARYQSVLYHEAMVKIDDPQHPVTAAFEGKPFRLEDEFYEFQAPYSRHNLHVLLSIDAAAMVDVPKVTKFGRHLRTDEDYALSWVKEYGRGRVFVCALGHSKEIYWNPTLLHYLLDGLQLALGDLLPGATLQ